MSRSLATLAGALVLGTLLVGCSSEGEEPIGSGRPEPASTETSQPVVPGRRDVDLSVAAEQPQCEPRDSGQLCLVRVWFANQTTRAVKLDARSALVLDSSGTPYPVRTDASAAEVVLVPFTRSLVLMEVDLPAGARAQQVRWSPTTGPALSYAFPGVPAPTPTDTPTPVPTPTPTPSPTVSASPTPRPTTPRPTATPTRPRTSAPPAPAPPAPPPPTAPVGSIG